mmetsp:Transcript_71648/g.155924  ORF Transcript_71648/g.155924 Transcript_71648/m.155924 type:complete len:243 (+) Transcript_71648:425-1153(+)
MDSNCRRVSCTKEDNQGASQSVDGGGGGAAGAAGAATVATAGAFSAAAGAGAADCEAAARTGMTSDCDGGEGFATAVNAWAVAAGEGTLGGGDSFAVVIVVDGTAVEVWVDDTTIEGIGGDCGATAGCFAGVGDCSGGIVVFGTPLCCCLKTIGGAEVVGAIEALPLADLGLPPPIPPKIPLELWPWAPWPGPCFDRLAPPTRMGGASWLVSRAREPSLSAAAASEARRSSCSSIQCTDKVL